MAAAEARAAWQRTANRYFVQEDAKRAPKLACCPSSSSTEQYDPNNGNSTNGQEHSAPNFVPLHWNSMNSNLPPDTRWWLQLQPSFRCPQDFASERPNVLEDEPKERRVESEVATYMLRREILDHKNNESETPCMVSTAFMKKDSETRVDEMKTVSNISQQPLKRKVSMGDYLFQDGEFMDWKPGDWLISKKTEKGSPELDSPWTGGNKCEPWWHISDRDELASLVAQKSLENIENCDLPRPTQTVHVSKDPFARLESLDYDRVFTSSLSYKLHSNICDPSDYHHHSTISGSMDEEYWSSSDAGHLLSDTEKVYCTDHTCSHTTKDSPENRQTSDSNPSRAQLLEALRHSQTRAREAEIAAQKACNEKEHIVKLFFRQASHLFAYKQWLHMLQLESLCLQLRIKEHQISTLFPLLPWMPLSKEKKKKKKCGFCKYALAFAFGLGLAGAGLLLGWTVGWLLPHL